MISVLEGGVTEVPGFLAAGVRAGIKRRGLDLMLIVSEDGPVPAVGAFTTNSIKGASLLLTAKNLKNGKLSAIVANSGCANSYTGRRGFENARQMARLVSNLLGLRANDVAVASSGLIGPYLPMRKIKAGIRTAVKKLSKSRKASLDAAKAIMTTDTKPKEIAVRIDLEDGTKIVIAGIAKGAGMIKPNLQTATMLAFVFTDAAVSSAALREMLQSSIDRSFNMITVDNDTSTNDMVLILANGRARNRPITPECKSERFQIGLDYVLTELAKKIASDGEGASHLIEIQVKNARDWEDARRAALAVAGSNLVKTAIFGRNPNYGRIVAALGYSGSSFDPSKLSLELVSDLGRIRLIKEGKPMPRCLIAKSSKVMHSEEIKILIDLATGTASATAWGCDLTYDYVRINSRYTTS